MSGNEGHEINNSRALPQMRVSLDTQRLKSF